MPPLCVTKEEMRLMGEAVREAIEEFKI